MKKSMLLAALAVLSVSGSAMALIEGPPHPISVAGCPSGLASFFFVGNVDGPIGVCSYYMDWQSPFIPAGSAPCYISEQKALGQTSCLGNRLSNVTTTVMSVPNCCSGFDNFGLLEPNVTLVLAESFVAPTLNGLAVFANFPFIPRPISIL
jgi:hypothetical protein